MVDERTYWVVPRENDGLYKKRGLEFGVFLEEIGYEIIDGEKTSSIYFGNQHIGNIEGSCIEVVLNPHNEGAVPYDESSLAALSSVLNFIDILKANDVEYTEKFNREKMRESLKEREKSLGALLNRL